MFVFISYGPKHKVLINFESQDLFVSGTFPSSAFVVASSKNNILPRSSQPHKGDRDSKGVEEKKDKHKQNGKTWQQMSQRSAVPTNVPVRWKGLEIDARGRNYARKESPTITLGRVRDKKRRYRTTVWGKRQYTHPSHQHDIFFPLEDWNYPSCQP